MIIVLFHVIYLLGKHIYNIYHAKRLRALCDAAKETGSSKEHASGILNEALDFEDDDSPELLSHVVQSLRFSPPVYVQRYSAVSDVLVDPKYEGKLRKIVDFGCSEMSFLVYLKNIPGVEEILCVDVDKEILQRYKGRAEPLTAEFLSRRKKPLVIEIYEGSVTHNDKKLDKTDAVICIELIEHLYPDTLWDLPFNIFGYIMPKVVVITTPNADFNILFPDMSGYRHPDHKFEWTREQFQAWAENIVIRYPCYSVTFYDIAYGPKGTEELGGCSQMAVFHRLSPEIEENNQIAGVDQLFNTVAIYDYPIDIDIRSDEEKILDEAIYYINFLSYRDREYVDEVPLSDLLSYMKNTVTIETLKTVLEDAGWTIEERENELILLNRNGSFSDIDDDFLENDDVFDEEIEWNYEPPINEIDINTNEQYLHMQPTHPTNWHEESSIIIPENRSIVQENTYLFDGENSLLEQDQNFERPHVSSDSNIGYSMINDISLISEEECSNNPFPVTSYETEVGSRSQIDSNKLSNLFISSNNSSELKSSSFDNITIETTPPQCNDVYLKTTSVSNFQTPMYVLRSSELSSFNFESSNSLQNDVAGYQNGSRDDQLLLNSTLYSSEIANETFVNTEESITNDISGFEGKIPKGNCIQGNESKFSNCTSSNYPKINKNCNQQNISANSQACENNIADLVSFDAYNHQPKFSSSPKVSTKMAAIDSHDQNCLEHTELRPTLNPNIPFSIIKTFKSIPPSDINSRSSTESLNSSEKSNSNNVTAVMSCTISVNSDVRNTSNYDLKCSTSGNTEQELSSYISIQLMQDSDEKFAEKNSVIDDKSDVSNDMQNMDACRILPLDNESIDPKEKSVYCTTTLTKTDDINTKAHLENAINDFTQSDIKKESINSSKELSNPKSQNNDRYSSSDCAKEINVLEDDTFVSCKSNENTSSVQFASVLKDEETISTSKDISNMVGLASNTEAKTTSPLETPPNSWSPEIMDSGYPNSASAQDITPEYDLSSIAQDHIPDSESPSVAEAPRLGVLEPIEVENGDLANNNRDDEGNNMMAVDVNVEDLQPLIDVLENDLENENDIYVMQNGFPIWLLRILDMANPLDFDIQARQDIEMPVEIADDANYMGHDEGFDSSSSDSDIVYNEVKNDNKRED